MAWEDGPGKNPSRHSAHSLLPIVYEELRAAAGRLMAGERADHTLQRTALVHEAYARLAKAGTKFESELHFFNTAALAMRRILVDHANARSAGKRGAGAKRVDLDDANVPPQADANQLDWLALDEAIKELERVSPRRSQIVMLKYFAGLTEVEIAKLLSVGESTVRREWGTARLWLYEHMTSSDS